MNIALLCRVDETTAGIASYLTGRGHNVSRTDGIVSSVDLANYDIGISYNYRHILLQRQIDVVKLGIINFHTGLLPEQRGANPNVWSILQGRGGCTAHYIDSGVDTGPIITRTQVSIGETDTSESYYNKLQKALEQQLYDLWPIIEACGERGYRVPAHAQPMGEYWAGNFDTVSNLYGTHKARDLAELDRLSQHEKKIVDKLRARTFPPYEGCYYLDEDGEKVFYDIIPWKKR